MVLHSVEFHGSKILKMLHSNGELQNGGSSPQLLPSYNCTTNISATILDRTWYYHRSFWYFLIISEVNFYLHGMFGLEIFCQSAYFCFLHHVPMQHGCNHAFNIWLQFQPFEFWFNSLNLFFRAKWVDSTLHKITNGKDQDQETSQLSHPSSRT